MSVMSRSRHRRSASSQGLVRTVAQDVVDDDVSGLAAELAFRLFVAVFPLCIFLAACGALIASASGVDEPATEFVDAVGEQLPDDLASDVESQLRELFETRSAGPLFFGFVAAIWTGMMAMWTIVKALNRIHDVEDKRSLKRRIAVIGGLTLGAGLLVVTAFTIVLLGETSGRDLFGGWDLPEAVGDLLVSLRWIIVFALVAAAAALIYWLAPARETQFRWASAGSGVFALIWVLGSLGLMLYVTNVGTFNATYGALAGILVLLIWFYVTSFAFLVGAEVDAVLEQRKKAR